MSYIEKAYQTTYSDPLNKECARTSLVVQWIRTCLANTGDMGSIPGLERLHMPQRPEAQAPEPPNPWPRPMSRDYGACVEQLVKPACLEPTLCSKSHCREKPAPCKAEQTPLTAARGSPTQSSQEPAQPNKLINNNKKRICCLGDFLGSQWLRISPSNAGSMV